MPPDIVIPKVQPRPNYVIPMGKLILELRMKRNLTQEAVAEVMAIAKRTYENAEHSRRCRIETIEVIAAFFKVDVNELIDRPDYPSGEPVADVPLGFVRRDREVNQICDLLLSAEGEKSPLVLTGLPGVGKTTISRTLQGHELLVGRYGRRIFHCSVGEYPNIIGILDSWNLRLGGPALHPNIPLNERRESVREAAGRAGLLLIIDDVWRPEDARDLMIGGTRSRTLVTSRRLSIADHLALPASQITLKGLSAEQSMQLLRNLCGSSIDDCTVECEDLVMAVDGLPLALQVAGRMINQHVRRSRPAKELLGDLVDLTKLMPELKPSEMHFSPEMAELADQTHENITVARVLLRSVRTLSTEARRAFASLAHVKPKPAVFPTKDFRRRNSGCDVDAVLRELDEAGLIETVGPETFEIHAILVALARYIHNERNP